jgi:hypothetical protein
LADNVRLRNCPLTRREGSAIIFPKLVEKND